MDKVQDKKTPVKIDKLDTKNRKVIVKNPSDVELLTTGFIHDAKTVKYVELVTATLVVSRNVFSTIGSGLKSLVGGRLQGQIKLMKMNRAKIIEEIREKAAAVGANAVISFRIDVDNVQGFVNFFAYGTAVIIKY